MNRNSRRLSTAKPLKLHHFHFGRLLRDLGIMYIIKQALKSPKKQKRPPVRLMKNEAKQFIRTLTGQFVVLRYGYMWHRVQVSGYEVTITMAYAYDIPFRDGWMYCVTAELTDLMMKEIKACTEITVR